MTETTVASRLEATPETVWARVIAPEGVNDEMRPWLRMTVPAGFVSLDPESVVLGERIGRCWILLFGWFLPPPPRAAAAPVRRRPTASLKPFMRLPHRGFNEV